MTTELIIAALNKAAFLIILGHYLWATAKIFVIRNDAGAKTGQLVYAALSSVALVIYLYGIIANPVESEYVAITALFVYILSLMLFWWTVRTLGKRPLGFAFTDQSARFFIHDGAFGLVRNPFYTSYTLTWIACICAINDHLLYAIPSIPLLFYYYMAAKKEERMFAGGQFAREHAAYRHSVPMFIPGMNYITRVLQAIRGTTSREL